MSAFFGDFDLKHFNMSHNQLTEFDKQIGENNF